MSNSESLWSRLKGAFGVSSGSSSPASEILASSSPSAEKHGVQFDIAASGPAAEVRPEVHRQVTATGDELAAVQKLRRLFHERHYQEAWDLCEERFNTRRDLRDEYGQPIYYKEMLRLSVALGQSEMAQGFAERLKFELESNDPCVEIVYARHFSGTNDLAAARAAWTEVLERSPDNGEAATWLRDHPERVN